MRENRGQTVDTPQPQPSQPAELTKQKSSSGEVVIKEVGVPQEIYDKLKQQLMDKEAELNHLNETLFERTSSCDKLSEQLRAIQFESRSKLEDALNENKHLKNVGYERDKANKQALKDAEEECQRKVAEADSKREELVAELADLQKSKQEQYDEMKAIQATLNSKDESIAAAEHMAALAK